MAKEYKMPRMDKLSTYKTAFSEDSEGNGVVIYSSTKIVEWTADTITLRSGGWETVTTKRKMNQAAYPFGLPYSVWQKNFVWHVDTPQGVVEFSDGMTFDRHADVGGVTA